MKAVPFLLAALCLATPAAPHEARVLDVTVEKQGMNWRVSVTMSHPDTGWDHYADGWEVLDRDGTRLGFRKLMHPHVEEQPFTRSLSGVVIPDGTREVFVRPRCTQHGWSENRTRITLKP